MPLCLVLWGRAGHGDFLLVGFVREGEQPEKKGKQRGEWSSAGGDTSTSTS